MDISQYKELFITEANEHLDALNKFLLRLENEPEDIDVLTEIFRAAHTLKGMAATMGYEQLTELAHEMENLLEHLRAGDIEVRPVVIDLLFSCFDMLGSIINAIDEDRPGEIDYGALVSEIRGVIEGAEAPSEEPEPEMVFVTPEEPARGEEEPEPEGFPPVGPQEPELPRFDEGELEREAEELIEEPSEEVEKPVGYKLEIAEEIVKRYTTIPGMRVLRLIVELDRGCLLKSVRVFMVFKKLAQLGEVLGSLPAAEALEDEKFEYSFQVGLATREASEKVERALLSIAEIAEVGSETIAESELTGEPGIPSAAPPEKPRETEPLVTARKTQSVRVNIVRLDKLMNLVGELVINRTRLEEIVTGFEIPELREALDHTSRLTAELQDEVMKTRMVPVEQVFNRFPRMVRDVAKNQGKEVDFIIEGKDIELDRTILDEISDPLMHMLRNAVDHGIGIPLERHSKGKPQTGTIRLSAYRDRNYVAIEVEDDGEGIDLEEVFDSALRLGLIGEEERARLVPEDLLRVISMPGFSMSDKVNGVSGRGVGMDVVRAKAESIGGFVIIETAPGVGTKVTLKLPLTLAIVQALMVEVAGETYAIPLGTVRETHEISPDDVMTVRNNEAIFLRDETVPLVRLDSVLGCDHALNGSEPFPVVITEVGPRLVAIAVHSLLGQQEIVISPLDKYLKRVRGFAGATILGTGRVALILDVPSLI